MKNCFVALSLSLSLLSSAELFAHGGKDGPHCEKKDKSGKVSDDVEAKDKAACKEKGGTWVEPKKDADHAHEGEHKHDH
jgi:hypothetical protein